MSTFTLDIAAVADESGTVTTKVNGPAPVDGCTPITSGGVTLAVVVRPKTEHEQAPMPFLARRAATSGAWKQTGRMDDFARALALGLLAVGEDKPAPVKAVA